MQQHLAQSQRLDLRLTPQQVLYLKLLQLPVLMLEQRIKDSMAEVLNHALRDLTNEVRVGLHDTIEKIVARAVTQELIHLQARKK